MRFILFTLLLFSVNGYAQYIGVKARYSETRLVNDAPHPPKRENRLILSFYAVTFTTDYVWTPIVLSNYDLWVYKQGFQYGNQNGGVLDSTGNNYPGYPYPAPRAVAYFNTLGLNYVDCDPNLATHYVVNGQELDCGFVTVSYYDVDGGTGNPIECFPAPNILLPLYSSPHPYSWNPGNVNFGGGDIPPGPPYNLYNFSCGGLLQLVQRGLLAPDTSSESIPLPVTFAFVRGEIQGTHTANIWWSNLTESAINRYEVQQSIENGPFTTFDTVAPINNNHERADYTLSFIQQESNVLYRIKAVENSGQFIYSSIIHLRLAGTNGPAPHQSILTVYPNPFTNEIFNFRLTNAEQGRYISSIVTPDGKVIKQKLIMHGGGDLTRPINPDGLLPGMYQFVLRSSNNIYTQKFVYVR